MKFLLTFQNERTPSTKLVNKRLVSVMEGNVPQSPFHVDTPNSPYGRCFQDNPSKKFRKDCKKWVDQLPDWHEPPAKKPRRNSTVSLQNIYYNNLKLLSTFLLKNNFEYF